jgi:hypothetical protein
VATKFTEKRVRNRLMPTLERWRRVLEAPRPASLRPEVQWGISWDLKRDGDNKDRLDPPAVQFVVHSIDPKFLGTGREASVQNPFDYLGRFNLDKLCQEAARAIGEGASVDYTWTLGCVSASRGDLTGLTEVK